MVMGAGSRKAAQVNVRLTPEWQARLEAFCHEQVGGQGDVVRSILTDFLTVDRPVADERLRRGVRMLRETDDEPSQVTGELPNFVLGERKRRSNP